MHYPFHKFERNASFSIVLVFTYLGHQTLICIPLKISVIKLASDWKPHTKSIFTIQVVRIMIVSTTMQNVWYLHRHIEISLYAYGYLPEYISAYFISHNVAERQFINILWYYNFQPLHWLFILIMSRKHLWYRVHMHVKEYYNPLWCETYIVKGKARFHHYFILFVCDHFLITALFY